MKFVNVFLAVESVVWMKTEHIPGGLNRDFLGWLLCCWFLVWGFLLVFLLLYSWEFYVRIEFRGFVKLVLIVC